MPNASASTFSSVANPTTGSRPGAGASPLPTPFAPLFGVLTRAGTFVVGDEESTGLLVSMSVEDLRTIRHVPMYRRVTVLAVDDYAALEERVAETLANRHGHTVIGQPAIIYRGDAAAILAVLGLYENS